MKIITITSFTPYYENYNGISALLYYLLKYRPQDIKVQIYSFDLNRLPDDKTRQIEKDLNLNIIKLPLPKWLKFLKKNRILYKFMEFAMLYNIYSYIPIPKNIKKIIDKEGDLIWIYPYHYFNWTKSFPNTKFVITGCDNNALLYKRCKKDLYFRDFLKQISINIRYFKETITLYQFKKKNTLIHFVGNEDLKAYMKQTKADNAFYSPHPHYITSNKDISFNKKKIQVLITGNNDFYMHSECNKLIDTLILDVTSLKEKITITFMNKGWDSTQNKLQKVGYECKWINWVDNYIDEIIKYDVQIVPLSIGTGTKGKVLDAISNGLLCIGTKYALENIKVENNKSCIIYNEASEIPYILIDIYNNREKYEQIALEGLKQVRYFHSPEKTSNDFFQVLKNFAMN